MTLIPGNGEMSTNNENGSIETSPTLVVESLNDVEIETPEQMLSKANEFLAEGKRHLVCRNFQDAVNAFDWACEFFCKRYGDLAIECAEPFFYYGKSLIELERVNQSIITLANKGDQGEAPSSESEDSECEDEAEPEPAAPASEPTPAENKDETLIPDDPKVEDQSKAAETDQQEAPAVPSCDEETPAAPPGDEDLPAEDEDQTKTALAWQFLDLARVINEKELTETKDSEERKRVFLRLSEIRVCLGEVCVLDEKYDDAVTEFQSAQQILGEHFAGEDRRLAETYFHIGSASEYDAKFDFAKENFRKAVDILEMCLKKLEIEEENNSHLTQKESNDDKSSQESSKCEEINELKKLIADMHQRLADVVDSEKEQQKTKADLAEFIQKVQPHEANDQAGSGNTLKIPADDVTHLVRKPLKRDSDSGAINVSEPKRVKFDDETNGDKNPASENGQITCSDGPGAQNGVSEKAPTSDKGHDCSPSSAPSEKNSSCQPVEIAQ